jgi:hypothetical protein
MPMTSVLAEMVHSGSVLFGGGRISMLVSQGLKPGGGGRMEIKGGAITIKCWMA